MAKPTSFNKREVEKQKQRKRIEKQKKKEERKASGTSSFEDMIAYVDENGMISSTQSEPGTKQEVDLESIEIATPKKVETEEISEYQGRVEYFNDSKGFGFIKDINSSEKYFFHISQVDCQVTIGMHVTFELEKGPRGLNAVKVKKQ